MSDRQAKESFNAFNTREPRAKDVMDNEIENAPAVGCGRDSALVCGVDST
jgi:hypothetical protein